MDSKLILMSDIFAHGFRTRDQEIATSRNEIENQRQTIAVLEGQLRGSKSQLE